MDGCAFCSGKEGGRRIYISKGDEDFSLEHVTFKVPTEHPSRDAPQEFAYTGWKLRRQALLEHTDGCHPGTGDALSDGNGWAHLEKVLGEKHKLRQSWGITPFYPLLPLQDTHGSVN